MKHLVGLLMVIIFIGLAIIFTIRAYYYVGLEMQILLEIIIWYGSAFGFCWGLSKIIEDKK